MRLFDLSLRQKIPLWGSVLIVASTLTIAAVLLARSYDDLKQDLFISSEALGQTLANTLFPTLLHDDLWRAFEIVQAPFRAEARNNPLDVESIFVVDPDIQVFVANDPKHLPTLARLEDLGPDHRSLAESLRTQPLDKTRAFDFKDSSHYYVALPIAEGGRQVGTLVISHSREAFWARFLDLALRSVLIGALVIAGILPLNWYWGQHMARPLVDLARRMDAVAKNGPDCAEECGSRESYPYRDELGHLFVAFDTMRTELQAKARMEREMVQTERLAAIGRLAAGIAHEVNNPLGGMLIALDTLKARGEATLQATKTMGLLERGLKQIQETVAALLVQARDQSRNLTPEDVDDVRTLIQPQVLKKSQQLSWQVDLPATTDLPAAACRQILINLLLNAVQATREGGRIAVTANIVSGNLHLWVANEADPIAPEQMEHLFEPFVSHGESGHGLGLWVSYQIVQQMGGCIAASCGDGEVKFEINLPLESATCDNVSA